jgi:hypothetical protein
MDTEGRCDVTQGSGGVRVMVAALSCQKSDWVAILAAHAEVLRRPGPGLRRSSSPRPAVT